MSVRIIGVLCSATIDIAVGIVARATSKRFTIRVVALVGPRTVKVIAIRVAEGIFLKVIAEVATAATVPRVAATTKGLAVGIVVVGIRGRRRASRVAWFHLD